MNASTRKALRTGLQVAIPAAAWIAAAGPTALDRVRANVNAPAWVWSAAAAVVGGSVAVTKVWHALEGRFPRLGQWMIPVAAEVSEQVGAADGGPLPGGGVVAPVPDPAAVTPDDALGGPMVDVGAIPAQPVGDPALVGPTD